MNENEDRTAPTDFDSPIHQICFSLMACDTNGEHHYISGTAVSIASRLAITAKHVIYDFERKYGRFKYEGTTGESSFSLQAVQILSNGTQGALWDVRKVTLCGHTDVAILFLTPKNKVAQQSDFLSPAVQLMPPAIGETLTAFGYRRSKAEVSDDKIEWLVDPVTSHGVVKEVHGEKRDSSMLSFPCFQIDAQYDGGMSGGPVINRTGHLIGIVCSSISPKEAGGEHVSYVTLLYPVLSVRLELKVDGQDKESFTVYELCGLKAIKALNLEKAIVKYDGVDIVQVGMRIPRQ